MISPLENTSNYGKMSAAVSDYHKSSMADRPQIWEEVLELARKGESGIDTNSRNNSCILFALLEPQYDETLALSFFEALPQTSKTLCLDWRNSVYGNTVLMTASALGFNKLLKSILEFGWDLDIGDEEDGSRPLSYAVAGNNVDGARILLDAGACPNAVNSAGCTPLMDLCKMPPLVDRSRALAVLFSRGAHTHYKDDEGNTALDLAQASGNTKAYDFLFALKSSQEEASHLHEVSPPITQSPRNRRI